MTKAATKARRRAAREAMVIAAVAFEGVEDVGKNKMQFVCGGMRVTRTVQDLINAHRLTWTAVPRGDGTYRAILAVRRSY